LSDEFPNEKKELIINDGRRVRAEIRTSIVDKKATTFIDFYGSDDQFGGGILLFREHGYLSWHGLIHPAYQRQGLGTWALRYGVELANKEELPFVEPGSMPALRRDQNSKAGLALHRRVMEMIKAEEGMTIEEENFVGSRMGP
jgi:hypothetical protein